MFFRGGIFAAGKGENAWKPGVKPCLGESFEKPLTKGVNGVYCRPLSTGLRGQGGRPHFDVEAFRIRGGYVRSHQDRR